MIVVVANQWDQAARTFAARWAGHNIRTLTPQDLSRAGWRQRQGDRHASSVVVQGEPIPQSEITGVLTRLPCVYGEELGEITSGDRAYVAAEMTAFLWYWLSSLDCPVINRPTSTCLAGPGWGRENWVRAAATVGIPTLAVRQRANRSKVIAAEDETRDNFTVSVVGESVFGCDDYDLQRGVRCLSQFAGLDFLAARFSGAERQARLIHVNVLPELSDDHIAGALLDYLQPRTVAYS